MQHPGRPDQRLGFGLGLVASGAVVGFLELNQASSVFFSSRFNQWTILFAFGFFGMFLLAGANWYERRNRRNSLDNPRSIMKTNALEMGAFIVMSIGALATLNEDRTHVYGFGIPFWTNAIAAFVSGIVSAGLISAGILLIRKSFRAEAS